MPIMAPSLAGVLTALLDKADLDTGSKVLKSRMHKKGYLARPGEGVPGNSETGT